MQGVISLPDAMSFDKKEINHFIGGNKRVWVEYCIACLIL